MTMKFKMVAESKRNKWFADNFGIGCDGGTHTEFAFYDLLSDTCPSFDGGYFEMVEFKNGAKALMLNDDTKVKVSVSTNYYDGEMSRRALSLAAWMVTVNHMCWNLYNLSTSTADKSKKEQAMKLSQKFSDMYYKIRDALMDDEEVGAIFAYAD